MIMGSEKLKKDPIDTLKQSVFLKARISARLKPVLEELQEEHWSEEGNALSESGMERIALELNKELITQTNDKNEEHLLQILHLKMQQIVAPFTAVKDKQRFADAFIGRLRHHLSLG